MNWNPRARQHARQRAARHRPNGPRPRLGTAIRSPTPGRRSGPDDRQTDEHSGTRTIGPAVDRRSPGRRSPELHPRSRSAPRARGTDPLPIPMELPLVGGVATPTARFYRSGAATTSAYAKAGRLADKGADNRGEPSPHDFSKFTNHS